MWIVAAFGLATRLPSSPTDIFAPVATPADRVDLVSLYWHFVDVVWIAVFLVVYVVGR